MTQRQDYFPLIGGLDLVTPSLVASPGSLRATENYEPSILGGYKRIDGFDIYDGRPEPYSATYYTLHFINGSAVMTAGATLTGTSASALVLVTSVVESGSYGSGNATGYVTLYNLTGAFVTSEALKIGGVTKATSSGIANERGSATNDIAYMQLAISSRRSVITGVPGSGPILGVWFFKGYAYAFRNNIAGTFTDMYKSSTSGWTKCALGTTLKYNTLTVAPLVGETITGVSSGSSGVISKIIQITATTGTLILISATGPFTLNEVVNSPTGHFKAASVGVVNAITKNGSFEFVNHNFLGDIESESMYGVNGVNNAFEWDGSSYAPIYTGMPLDTPVHIAAHSKSLFLSFKGSLQFSALGGPHNWTVLQGAGELTMGDNITGLLPNVGGTLIIFSRNKIHVLYGTSSIDFELRVHSVNAGALDSTMQQVDLPIFLDDRGLRSLTATQNFGDFASTTISAKIASLLSTVYPLSSVVNKTKNQYRLFFTDGSGIIYDTPTGTFSRINYGITPIKCCSAEQTNGLEILLFGDSDGNVYRSDVGTSFNGLPISAFIRTHFYSYKRPNISKRFYSISVETDISGSADLKLVVSYSNGSSDIPSTVLQNFSVNGSGGSWDEDNWLEFEWSSEQVGSATAYIAGTGINASITILSNTSTEQPHILQSIVTRYSVRGIKK